MAAHSTLTGADLHEAKGIAAASAGQLIIADGAGSADLRFIPHGALYYDNIGTGTTITTPTAYTLVGPATTGDAGPREVSHNSLGRLTYTGATTMDFNLNASITLKHSSASLVDTFFQFFKNGVALAGAQHVTAALSGNYQHVSLSSHGELATNDYIEVFTKSASGNVIVHSFSMLIEGKI